MRIAYANCFLPDGESPDRLLTDETAVAEAFPGQVLIPEVLNADDPAFGDEVAEANALAWRLAFDWFEGADPTGVDGVSAADIAGSQVALAVIIPALRGVLDARAAPRAVAALDLWTPSNGSERYRGVEAVQAEAFAAALGVPVERRESDDPRNAMLASKYEQVRDPEWLAPEPRGARLKAAVAGGLLGARGRLGRRDALLVYEYNPTNEFAVRYAQRGGDRRFALARSRTPRPQLAQIARAGDRFVLPPPIAAGTDPVALDGSVRERFVFRGVDLWPVVEPRLTAIVGRYRAYVRAAAPRWRKLLRANRVKAVLVPFDTPPEPRLLVRVAQSEGIPTFSLNDGWKGDDFSVEGMSTDHALAWSEQIAESHARRRRRGDVVVTGNPQADRPRAAAARPRPGDGPIREVLVGTSTFSPVDIASRRTDSERFLERTIAGVRASERGRDARIRLKLHPADRIDHYAHLIDDRVDVVASGDILDMFDTAELYVSTYSTSLFAALAAGVPSIYLRVNDQRLHAPFNGDPFLERLTADSAGELAQLIDDPVVFAAPGAPELERWMERYLGPTDGRSVERIETAIAERL